MKLVKKTAEYSVYERRDGRFAVTAKNGKMINGDAKVEILVKEKLRKAPAPKPVEEEVPAEEVATEEAPAEEAAAEEEKEA